MDDLFYVCRLEAYDRNKNFKNVVDITVPDVTDVSWPSSGYISLQLSHHDLLAKVSLDKIRSYFCYRQAIDSLSEQNIQALDKGQLLLDSSRVEAAA